MKIRYDYKVHIKKSLKHANESKIKYAIIIGESEVKNNYYTVKNLFDATQKTRNRNLPILRVFFKRLKWAK